MKPRAHRRLHALGVVAAMALPFAACVGNHREPVAVTPLQTVAAQPLELEMPALEPSPECEMTSPVPATYCNIERALASPALQASRRACAVRHMKPLSDEIAELV